MARATDYLDGFLLAKRAERRSPRTLGDYRYHLRGFLASANGRDIADLSATDIRCYLVEREHLSPNTVHGDFRAIRAFFHWLEAEGIIHVNPVRRVKAPRLPKMIIQTFTAQHIADMLAVCARDTFLGCRNRAMLLVLLDTGVRREELATLQLQDVHEGSIQVMGKGSKQRQVSLSSTTQKALWRYMLYHHRRSDALWLTEEGQPMHAAGVRMMIRTVCARAGVSGVRCSAHTFRHTFAITYLRNGGDIFTLQYLLGHSDLAMVKRYLGSLNAEDAARAHARFSPVESLVAGSKKPPRS